MYVGLTLLVLGEGLFTTFGVDASLAKIIPLQMIAGIGAGFLLQPPLIALQAMVKQEHVAVTTATNGFVRNIATSLSVVVGGVIFQNGMEGRRESLAAAGVSPFLVQAFSGREAQANVVLVNAIDNNTQKAAVKSAYAESFQNVWIFYACSAACAFAASFFVVAAVLSREHVEFRPGLPSNDKSPKGKEEGGENIELRQVGK